MVHQLMIGMVDGWLVILSSCVCGFMMMPWFPCDKSLFGCQSPVSLPCLTPGGRGATGLGAGYAAKGDARGAEWVPAMLLQLGGCLHRVDVTGDDGLSHCRCYS